jgi:hypothetical protein
MKAPPGVTSCRVHTWQVRPGPAMRDPRGGGDGAAARAGGDVGGRDQVAVPGMPAVRAAEDPPGGFGYPSGAGGACRGRAPLVNERHGDPGGLGLVGQGPDQVPDPPSADPLIVPPTGGQAEHAARVADRQRADAMPKGPGNYGLGGFVLGLPDPAPVPCLGGPLAAPELPPPSRPAPPSLRCPPGGRPAAGPGVAQVLAALSPDRPPGHQQELPVRVGRSVRVDDPQVHPRYPARIRSLPFRVCGDWYLRGHIDVQPSRFAQQSD